MSFLLACATSPRALASPYLLFSKAFWPSIQAPDGYPFLNISKALAFSVVSLGILDFSFEIDSSVWLVDIGFCDAGDAVVSASI